MRYLGYCYQFFYPFKAALTLFGSFFQMIRLDFKLTSTVPLPRENKFSWFGLFRFRSPLLTESLCFLFLGLLRCFTSPRVAVHHYEFMMHYPLTRMGFPIRNSAGQSLFAAHRSLSQLTTSFIAC